MAQLHVSSLLLLEGETNQEYNLYNPDKPSHLFYRQYFNRRFPAVTHLMDSVWHTFTKRKSLSLSFGLQTPYQVIESLALAAQQRPMLSNQVANDISTVEVPQALSPFVFSHFG